MLFTLRELVDLVIMTFAIGYIFSTFIKRKPTTGYDPLTYFKKNNLIEDIKYGVLIAAPAIVLHELAHKFTAMAFGASATLHAPLGWYFLVIMMRLLNFPFMFFVGGYVTITGLLTPLQSALISFAGPLTNLMLYLLSISMIKFKLIDRKHFHTLKIVSRINLFLFAFNLIPLPGFDGYNFFTSLLRVFL